MIFMFSPISSSRTFCSKSEALYLSDCGMLTACGSAHSVHSPKSSSNIDRT
jgi:hypothetical protein